MYKNAMFVLILIFLWGCGSQETKKDETPVNKNQGVDLDLSHRTPWKWVSEIERTESQNSSHELGGFYSETATDEVQKAPPQVFEFQGLPVEYSLRVRA